MRATLILALAAFAAQIPAQPPGPEQPRPWNELELGGFLRAVLHGDLWAYHIRTQNTYHSTKSAALTEFTVRLGAELSLPDYEWLRGQVRVTAEGVLGRPDNWTAPAREGFGVLLDLASLAVDGTLGPMPFTLTAGRQELAFGDGFLIYDFHSEKRAVWTTPLRSAPALRATLKPVEPLALDLFGVLIDEDRLSYEAYLGSGTALQGGGRLYGANARLERDDLGATDLGLFYKNEDFAAGRNGGLDPDSDTWALTLRHARDIGPFALSAELVKQWGRTRVVRNAVRPGPREERDAWGGNAAATLRLGEAEDAPYIRARYAYFGGDRGGSARVESFDPFFYGFSDWGTWYLGDMTSYSLTNTNARVAALEFGASPVEQVKLRLLLYDFTLDRKMPFSSSRAWSREANLVVDWFPAEWLFLGTMVGAALPGQAAEDFNGSDETQTEWMGWVGLTF